MTQHKKFSFIFPITSTEKGKTVHFDDITTDVVASVSQYRVVRAVDINSLTDGQGNEITKWVKKLDPYLWGEIIEAAMQHAENLFEERERERVEL